jgi:hypothetical protein
MGKPKKDSFDVALVAYIQSKMNSGKVAARPEDNIEVRLLQFCDTNGKDMMSLLTEASIKDDASMQILEELGLTQLSVFAALENLKRITSKNL